jgi:hypothetical protein
MGRFRSAHTGSDRTSDSCSFDGQTLVLSYVAESPRSSAQASTPRAGPSLLPRARQAGQRIGSRHRAHRRGRVLGLRWGDGEYPGAEEVCTFVADGLKWPSRGPRVWLVGSFGGGRGATPQQCRSSSRPTRRTTGSATTSQEIVTVAHTPCFAGVTRSRRAQANGTVRTSARGRPQQAREAAEASGRAHRGRRRAQPAARSPRVVTLGPTRASVG